LAGVFRGDDVDQPALVIHDHQAAQALAVHQLHRVHGLHPGTGDGQLDRHDVACREHLRVRPFGH